MLIDMRMLSSVGYSIAEVLSVISSECIPRLLDAWGISLLGGRRMSGHPLPTFDAMFRGYRRLQSSGFSMLMLDNCMKSVISKSDQNRSYRNV